jgi:LysR family transcriptional regulator, low CO2-responsive transcriptional regulator
VTLTQLSAFVLVARLGSVTAAAGALGVSEPAVSQALAALRQHLGDPLIVRSSGGMTLTAGGSRLLTIASQMVALGAEAEAAVRAAQGAAEQLRIIATSTIAEFVAAPLVDAFTGHMAGAVEASCGVAPSAEMPVLVSNRLADVAIGPYLGGAAGAELVSEPILRCRVIAVGSGSRDGRSRMRGGAGQWPWMVDPSGTDPASDTSVLLRRLRIPEARIRVFPNQTAAWEAAAGGAGVALATAHLVAPQLRRGELAVVATPVTPVETCWYATALRPDRRSAATGSFRRFLGTPKAMQLMRAPGAGVPPSRFRPPVYVTIWS